MAERDLESGSSEPPFFDDVEGGVEFPGASGEGEEEEGVTAVAAFGHRKRHEDDFKPAKRQQETVKPKDTKYNRENNRTELKAFQTLVGVHFLKYGGGNLPEDEMQDPPASVWAEIFKPAKAAARRHRNRGLYDRCITMEMKMGVMYSLAHYIITFLYLLQVLVAATLTAISAYTEANTAVTVLGAINTVLAGILAWLNGQGMPHRYRRARDQFRECVKAIEFSERMFAEIDYVEWPEGSRPNPISERDRLEKLYDDARRDQEGNYPDTVGLSAAQQAQERLQEVEAKAKRLENEKGSGEIEALKKMGEDMKLQLARLDRREAELAVREQSVNSANTKFRRWEEKSKREIAKAQARLESSMNGGEK